MWPRWSPDGKWVAFMRDAGGNEQFAIWIVDRDGEHERKLTADDAAMHRGIAWSPDGRSIACVANIGGGRFAIQLFDVATGARRALTDGSFDHDRPRFSPDGKWILFESWREGSRVDADLYLIPSAGGDAIRARLRAGRGHLCRATCHIDVLPLRLCGHGSYSFLHGWMVGPRSCRHLPCDVRVRVRLGGAVTRSLDARLGLQHRSRCP